MSGGLLCPCATGFHPARFGGKDGFCGRYSADQELGGLCGSCASGWHRPCDKPRFSPGSCVICGWHGSDHEGGM